MNIKRSLTANIPKLARAICEHVWMGSSQCVCVCVWWGVDVCWTALTVRPFQTYITEPAGLFPIATLTEVKGYVPPHPPTTSSSCTPGWPQTLLTPRLAADRAAAHMNLNLTEWWSRDMRMRINFGLFALFHECFLFKLVSTSRTVPVE